MARSEAAQEILTDTITAHVKAGGTWTQLAQKIQTHDKVADISTTLADLAKAGKDLGADREKINSLVYAARNQINKLSPGDAPTKYLKDAYGKLIKAVESGKSVDAINKALGKAQAAKIRYNAERISRTEMARAYNEGVNARFADDESVTGYKWSLSSRHVLTDECTLFAELDNGAGPGVYQKDDFPTLPAHPNCMCIKDPWYGEMPKKVEFRRVKDFLKEQPDKRRADMIGKAEAVNETLYRRGLEKRNIHFGEDPRRVPEELIEKVVENVNAVEISPVEAAPLVERPFVENWVPPRLDEKPLTGDQKSGILINRALYPDELAGVKRGERDMTWDEANHGRGNPNYKPFGGEEGYRVNCQTCVVAHEARLRGYDVQALPNLKAPGSASLELSNRTQTAWIDPSTGTHPKKFSRDVKTAKAWSQELDGLAKEGERYTFEFNWRENDSKHIIFLDRTAAGKLRFHDPQTGETFIGVEEIKKYLTKVKLSVNPMLVRVDNMKFNLEVVNEVLKGSV